MALAACTAEIDERGRELTAHGTTAFPIACYHDDLLVSPVPWHWHQELEVVVITAGRCTVAIGQEKRCLEAGEGFFVNSSVLHGAWNVGGEACRFHSLVFHPRLVGGSLDSVFYGHYLQPILDRRDLEGLFLLPGEDWHGELLRAVEIAWQACVQEPAGYEFTVRQALSQMIFTLHSHLTPIPQAPQERHLREAERIKAMLTFIHDHFGDDLTVEAIAASALISASEALRCFRATIGTSPMQYVKQYRLRQAARLLEAAGEKIADIAFRCGFQDMSYFTRAFRREFGCTPSRYRKELCQRQTFM